ncbi:hypothetical protein [uncultured Maribacter sp.]|uniref:hypothetical protein n=1 Tax=uncultured Maribacter sp. TaxID=431308 RepID=UPI002635380A|nr:hypothetical protein [uncultured Maribacter sp.]
MTKEEIYDLYVLQSKNVRQLKQVKNNLIKDINSEFKRKNNDYQIEIKTKLLALLYCTFSEAQFIQILHTPNGFSFTEIELIKKQRSIAISWKLMIDKAMTKVGDWENIPDLLNRRNKIHKIIKEYIEKPQELRNKIAHGQWVHALNSDNTKENENTTLRLKELNVIKLTIWSEVHQYLSYIIRDLVQSPQVGFHNFYWSNLVSLEEYIMKSKDWTIEKRKERILKKAYNNVYKK